MFLENFFTDRLAVVDSGGFEEPAFDAMPRPWYAFHFSPGPLPHDWAVIFHVWVDSGGYSLLIKHPSPEEGGFRVAAVTL